jgi:RNA polymerase sigma-70 factor, ECF subfamily
MADIFTFDPNDDVTDSIDPHCQQQGMDEEETDVPKAPAVPISAAPGFSPEDFEEERSWIERIRSNPDDFWYLYDKYYDPIYGFLLRRTRNVDIAQDLTSDTFAKALDKFWQYSWQGRPFVAWLLRIAANEANQFDRKAKRRPTDSLDDVDSLGERIAATDDSPEQKAMSNIENEALQAGLDKLDPACRTWLTLHYMEQLTAPQIASIEGVKEGTMKARISRCLSKLRKIMR